MLLVTGGAGFIGSHFVTHWLKTTKEPVVVLDALTYAGNLKNLSEVIDNPLLHWVEGDITDSLTVNDVFERFRPRGVVHFAAESHVDRSITDPLRFVHTNVLGTSTLLLIAQRWRDKLDNDFRFINISTDEVYGSIAPEAEPSDELTPFNPSSPYSASKASADQLGRAFFTTYGLPVITVRCTNNYGTHQYPEKLLPFMIRQATALKPLTIYGSGLQSRDWIHVSDFVNALMLVLEKGLPGECYNVSARHEMTNLEFIQALTDVLDELQPRKDGHSYRELITHVTDRPGHDMRYGLNAQKIQRELGWKPSISFDEGFRHTIVWYLSH